MVFSKFSYRRHIHMVFYIFRFIGSLSLFSKIGQLRWRPDSWLDHEVINKKSLKMTNYEWTRGPHEVVLCGYFEHFPEFLLRSLL